MVASHCHNYDDLLLFLGFGHFCHSLCNCRSLPWNILIWKPWPTSLLLYRWIGYDWTLESCCDRSCQWLWNIDSSWLSCGHRTSVPILVPMGVLGVDCLTNAPCGLPTTQRREQSKHRASGQLNQHDSVYIVKLQSIDMVHYGLFLEIFTRWAHCLGWKTWAYRGCHRGAMASGKVISPASWWLPTEKRQVHEHLPLALTVRNHVYHSDWLLYSSRTVLPGRNDRKIAW